MILNRRLLKRVQDYNQIILNLTILGFREVRERQRNRK